MNIHIQTRRHITAFIPKSLFLGRMSWEVVVVVAVGLGSGMGGVNNCVFCLMCSNEIRSKMSTAVY